MFLKIYHLLFWKVSYLQMKNKKKSSSFLHGEKFEVFSDSYVLFIF